MSRPIIDFYLLVLSVMLLTGACSQSKEAPVNHETDPKELSMNVEHKTDLSSQQMPPIDAAAPVVFETASFGLG